LTRYRPHVALVDCSSGRSPAPRCASGWSPPSRRRGCSLFSGAGEISPQAARAAGASGFAYKDWPARKIAGAVRLVGLGKTVFEHPRKRRPTRQGAGVDRSRARRARADGLRRHQSGIGEALHLSRHTVKEHSSSVYRKLDVRNRTEAVQRAQRLGTISLTEPEGPAVLESHHEDRAPSEGELDAGLSEIARFLGSGRRSTRSRPMSWPRSPCRRRSNFTCAER